MLNLEELLEMGVGSVWTEHGKKIVQEDVSECQYQKGSRVASIDWLALISAILLIAAIWIIQVCLRVIWESE
jgi:hypothetical protein